MEGDVRSCLRLVQLPISIHALRVEGDLLLFTIRGAVFLFLSTPSGWRATIINEFTEKNICISIHALRVEGDHRAFDRRAYREISIHALRVEGDLGIAQRRAEEQISIHALRVEGDSKNGQSFHLFLRKREKNLPL